MDKSRDARQGGSGTSENQRSSRDYPSPVELEAPLAGDEDNEDESFPREHVPFQDDFSLDSLDEESGLPQGFQAPEALKESTSVLDEVTAGHSPSQEVFEHSNEQVLRSGQEGVSETPAALDIGVEGRQDQMGKGKGKEIHPLELDLSDDTLSDSPNLLSSRSSETPADTPTAMSFKERMKSHFARVKSKDAAKNDAALPTTSSRDLSEGQLELQRSEQQRDNEGFGPGEILSTGLSHSSLSSANPPGSQHQHDKDETCCTCDNEPSREDRQQHKESKREPWWWVVQTGFYYLVYCVCCDFATAAQHGSQLSRHYGPHINGGHCSVIIFATWWQFFRFVLGMMYLGSWLSSGAARLAIANVAVCMDRDAIRSLVGKMEQEVWRVYDAVQSVMTGATFRLGKMRARGSKA